MPPTLRLLLRRILSRCLRLALRLRSRPYPVDQDTVALVIAPHPDDETLGCGGLLLRKRAEGVAVRVAYVTDGSASHPSHPALTPGALATLREAEARRAMDIIGVESTGLHFLGARDGTLAHLDRPSADELVLRIAALLRQVKPDEILLPCRHDGSSEHDATFGFVMRALEEAKLRPRILEFPVWSWWNPRLLCKPLVTSRRVWRVDFRGYGTWKRRALDAYGSQIAAIPPSTRPLLTPEFISFFSSSEEFFFEM